MYTIKYSKLRDEKRVNLETAIPLRMPFTLFVDTSNICNFKCNFCPQHLDSYSELSKGLKILSIKESLLIADQVKKWDRRLKTLQIHLSGEPLVNKNTPDIIKIFKKKDISEKIILTTNASLMTPEMNENIINSGVDYIRISIYGYDQKSYERNTNSNISFQDIKNNIRDIINIRNKKGANTFICTKMLACSPEEEKKFINEFSELSDESFIQPMHNWNNKNELECISQIVQQSTKTRIVCPYPFYTLIVHPNLDVSPCGCDFAHDLKLGNLHNETLQEIWTGTVLFNLQYNLLSREYSKIPICKKCSFFEFAGDNIDNLSALVFKERFESLYSK